MLSCGQKSGEPGFRPGPANRIVTWARLSFPVEIPNELLAIMIKHMSVNDLIETECFYNRDDALAGILTPPRVSQDGNKKETKCHCRLPSARRCIGAVPCVFK